MSALTADERKLLTIIREGRTITGCKDMRTRHPVPAHCTDDWAQAAADHIRAKVPDVDDTTLARIILAASTRITTLALGHGMRAAMHAGSVLAEAASELAALELDHPRLTDDPGVGKT